MKKIAENDKSIFYKNEMTKDYGDDFKTVLVELKETGEKEATKEENKEENEEENEKKNTKENTEKAKKE